MRRTPAPSGASARPPGKSAKISAASRCHSGSTRRSRPLRTSASHRKAGIHPTPVPAIAATRNTDASLTARRGVTWIVSTPSGPDERPVAPAVGPRPVEHVVRLQVGGLLGRPAALEIAGARAQPDLGAAELARAELRVPERTHPDGHVGVRSDRIDAAAA